MGCWGTGVFDDDAAYDYAAELEEEPALFFRRSFEVALAQTHVGFDEGHAVTVSAAHIDALLNKTGYRHDGQAAFDAWVARNASLAAELEPLRDLAVRALEALLHDSEADDVWSMTDKHAEWRKAIRALRGRLLPRGREEPA